MYNFKRDTKIYIVVSGNRYNIDLSQISFSQDITAISPEKNTIQENIYFLKTYADSYKPATFNFKIPALRENDFQVLFDRILDYKTFDLYIETLEEVFKITKCVITGTIFSFDIVKPIELTISGQGTRLDRVGTPDSYSYPGIYIDRSTSRTYNRITKVDINLGGVGVLDRIKDLYIEIQTKIKWIPVDILKDICQAGSISIPYPEEFVVEKRVLAGSISSYELKNLTFNYSTPLYILVGEEVGSTTYGFEFDLNSISYTSRIGTGEIFTHIYDWRLTENPQSLSELITYITDLEGVSNAILDFWGDPILDSDNQPILDSF